METKHKIIGYSLLISWFVLFFGMIYIGNFLLNNPTKCYTTYIIMATTLLIWHSLIVINYFTNWIKYSERLDTPSINKQRWVMYKFDNDEPEPFISIPDGNEFSFILKNDNMTGYNKIKFEKNGKSFELYIM
jgi:hypothetical protein